MKKIELNKKTLRVLSATESKLVAGGWCSYSCCNPEPEPPQEVPSDVSNCTGETPGIP